MIEIIIIGTVALLFVVSITLVWRSGTKKIQKEIELVQHALANRPTPNPSPPAPQVNVNMKPMEDAIKALPNKVLHSIQSSVNTKKGTLGELIGYIELEAKYDRIVPLGNIVDFMCIKFPSDVDEGRIDFVDIKTGKSSRLSKDQKALQQLITDKKINFVKLTVNTQTSEDIS